MSPPPLRTSREPPCQRGMRQSVEVIPRAGEGWQSAESAVHASVTASSGPPLSAGSRDGGVDRPGAGEWTVFLALLLLC